MPEFISSNQEYVEKAKKAGVPLIGNDIKSQIGATILHRVLAQLCVDRGIKKNKDEEAKENCGKFIKGEIDW